MPLTSAVTRKMDNNYVQVEISGKKDETRYYKVPEDRADSFQSEYKKNSKKAGWLSNGLAVVGIIIGTGIAYFATKKSQNDTFKLMTSLIAGVTGGISGMFGAAKIEMNDHQKLMYKYNATEINYE